MNHEQGRRARFEAIADEVYEPLQRYLRRRAVRDDADDAFSETLTTIWRRLDDVPPDAVLPWSYGVARRTLANQRRARGRHLRLVEKASAAGEPATTPGPDAADDLPEVREALATLPDPDREVLTLWAWEDLAPREIALILDTTPNAISLRLSRAKEKLGRALERQNAIASGHRSDEAPHERPEEHRP